MSTSFFFQNSNFFHNSHRVLIAKNNFVLYSYTYTITNTSLIFYKTISTGNNRGIITLKQIRNVKHRIKKLGNQQSSDNPEVSMFLLLLLFFMKKGRNMFEV